MKMPVVVVSVSLTLAIVLVAGFLIATQVRGRADRDRDSGPHALSGSGSHHLWKMKNAPAAMNPVPATEVMTAHWRPGHALTRAPGPAPAAERH